MAACQPDYYWRDYFGKIPHDAIVAGKDPISPVYIGQGYLHQPPGIFVAQIRPGIPYVDLPNNGPKRIEKFIKILCGPQENFEWLTVDGSQLHLVLNDKHAVQGGTESNVGAHYIGRITIEGEVKIGKINTWMPAPYMYYVHNNKEVYIQSYQILINRGPQIDVRALE